MIQRAPWQPVTEVLNSDDVCFFFTQHFGLRGCQEHHDMFVEDFSFSKDDNGVEYVTYEENPTKTRQGRLRKKRRVVQPKMFERFPDIQEQFCITDENYLFERSHV